jgi:hypothetical protein
MAARERPRDVSLKVRLEAKQWYMSSYSSFDGLGPLACSHLRISLKNINLTDS